MGTTGEPAAVRTMSDQESGPDGSRWLEDNWKNEDFLSFGANSGSRESESDAESIEPIASSSISAQSDSTGLPPWMDHMHAHGCPRLVALHNEIVQFVHLMEPTAEEIAQRQALIDRMQQLVATAFHGKARVEVFGSQATGLFLPASDIDLVVSFNQDEEELSKMVDEEHNNVDNALPAQSPLHTLADALRHEWLPELSYLEVIEQTRVPLVKFTHAASGTSVDICFHQENGPRAAALMTTYLHALPPLRPLTICLKYFLASRELHQPYTGGVGSYMLQLMIVSMLQHRARDAMNFRRPCIECLGSLLLEFFALYGQDFNYVTTGISVRHDGFYFPKGVQSKKEIFWQAQRPFSCALENPLETAMDVGQTSFRISLIQRAFGVAHKTLLAHVADPALPTHSILSTILLPTAEMRDRKLSKRAIAPVVARRDSSVKDKKAHRKRDRSEKRKRDRGDKKKRR